MVATTTEFFNEDFESCQQKFRNFLLPQGGKKKFFFLIKMKRDPE